MAPSNYKLSISLEGGSGTALLHPIGWKYKSGIYIGVFLLNSEVMTNDIE